jgi:hypothetical protein
MGKLAYPITVWRSYRDIKQSAEDLQTHKWGAAIKDFISGIAQLATLRLSLQSQAKPASTPTTPTPATPDTRFKWQVVAITAPERTQLKRHESLDVDLNSLTLNSSLGLYSHPTTNKTYAPVEGKVYPVTKRGTHWRIADTNVRGPRLSQNVSKQWVLDRETPAPRFSISNRLRTAYSVWESMNVDADGMSEIRRLFPQKARQIDEALDLATTYAWNCFQNLQLLKSSDNTVTPVHQLIMDLIDVPQVQPAHVNQLEKVLGDIFTALLDPSLRKPKTNRFVIGRLVSGAPTTFGFTVPTDAKRKIYLAEKFFDTGFEFYRKHLSEPAFPIKTHAQAVTLIHELSHIVCKTEDIAYLDSSRPFPHLIGQASATANDLKDALTTLQETALSIKTPLTQLFMTEDPDTGVWEDPGSTSYENTDRVKAHILTLTGGENLSAARKIFKRDPLVRLKVQLGNADSVSWLISQMGRQLHTSTP